MNKLSGSRTHSVTPAMKASSAFAVGIILCSSLNFPAAFWFYCASALLVLLIVSLIFSRQNSLQTLIFVLFCGGAVFSAQNELASFFRPFTWEINTLVSVNGMVKRISGDFYGKSRFVLQAEEITTPGYTRTVHGTITCISDRSDYMPIEGDKVRVTGRITQIPGFGRRNTAPQSWRMNANDVNVLDRTGSRFFTRIRDHFNLLADTHPSKATGQLLKAMLLGDNTVLPHETRASFNSAGISHILAVSGLHTGIIAGFLLLLFGFFPLARTTKISVVLLLLAFYAGICGFRPPVFRSFLMISFASFALLLGRKNHLENSVFLAMFIILALDPSALFGPSLQFSFITVWSIVNFYPFLYDRIAARFKMRKVFRYPVSLSLISIIALIATAPVSLYHFGTLALLGIPSNLIAIPLAFIFVNTGLMYFLSASMGFIFLPFTGFLSLIIEITGESLIYVSGLISSLRFSSIQTTNLPPLYFVLTAIWFFSLSRVRYTFFRKAVLFIPLIGFTLLTWEPVFTRHMHSRVIFFDVGQGDSALIMYYGKNFLIDTGPGSRFNPHDSRITGLLREAGVRSLDGIFISHFHEDHTGGFAAILSEMPHTPVFCRRGSEDMVRSIYMTEAIGISAGDSISFAKGGILVLSPGENIKEQNENNLSLVLRFNFGDVRVLFTGDLEPDMQSVLVSGGTLLRANLMKAPHHGSKLDREFLRSVSPEVAVISCGAGNPYGHPFSETLKLLQSSSVRIYRTDIHGTIRLNIFNLQPEIF